MEEKFLSSAKNCIVVACCTTFGILIQGIARLSGQLFVACMERYNTGRKDASFPFALCYTIRCISGPLVGYLGRRYRAVDVTILGIVLSIIGIGGCFFAEDMNAIILLWGCVYGLGFGLGASLVPEILHTYFTKHFDKVIGIFYGGASVSSMLLPVVTDKLLHTYGTSGTFLVLSGLMMQNIVAALILNNFERRRKVCSKLKSSQTTEITIESNRLLEDNELHTIPAETITEQATPSVGNSSLLETVRNIETNDNSEDKPTTTIMRTKEENVREKDLNGNILLDMIQMFFDPAFFIISITQCVSIFSFAVLFTIILDFSRDVGVSVDQEVYIYMGLGAGDLVGRFVLGFITDGGYMSKKNFTVSCYVLLAVTVWALSQVQGLFLTMVDVFAVGLLIGGQIMIGPGLLVKYMEKRKVVLSFANRFFIYPLFGISQPYITAYFRDILGSYDGLFYFLAVLNVATAFLTMLLPMTAKWKEKRIQALEKD